MVFISKKRGLKSDMYAASGRERGELRKELREREKKCSAEILSNSQAVVATCTVVGMKSILDVISDPEHFGLAIVDEAGQAVEPAIYPILRRCSKKLILAGDPAQLPPTVMSKNASILTKTLLEDLMGRFPANTVVLKRQYRMNKMISDWVSESMYRGELIADESVQNHTLADLLQEEDGLAKISGVDFLEDILR
jgi:DNA polymerase alpha-associated DNA helicase A